MRLATCFREGVDIVKKREIVKKAGGERQIETNRLPPFSSYPFPNQATITTVTACSSSIIGVSPFYPKSPSLEQLSNKNTPSPPLIFPFSFNKSRNTSVGVSGGGSAFVMSAIATRNSVLTEEAFVGLGVFDEGSFLEDESEFEASIADCIDGTTVDDDELPITDVVLLTEGTCLHLIASFSKLLNGLEVSGSSGHKTHGRMVKLLRVSMSGNNDQPSRKFCGMPLIIDINADPLCKCQTITGNNRISKNPNQSS
ncbi:hypothetical protein L1887_45905 [Cichorium endivia]|nr:hypothetical protein L1887_45905 [Cichorium endivia]